MRIVRPILQVTAFLFFAGWLLRLVTGRSLPLRASAVVTGPQHLDAQPVPVKPSPIEMLRQMD